MSDLAAFTEQLVTLYWQDADGEVDTDLLARVQQAGLTEGEWWEVMTVHWPHGFNLEELFMDLSWLHESLIWRANIPIGRIGHKRRPSEAQR